MKSFITFILVTLLSQISFTQDLLTFKDGSVKTVNVKEISETEVKYQKPENTSVMYTVLKTSLFSVQFKNGEKEVFNQTVSIPQNIVQPQKQIITPDIPIKVAPKVTQPEWLISRLVKPTNDEKYDVIIFMDGKIQKGKIAKVDENAISYTKEGVSDVTYSAELKYIKSFMFRNAKKEKDIIGHLVITETKTVVETPKTVVIEPTPTYEKREDVKVASQSTNYTTIRTNTYSDMYMQGKNDAKIYYTGYKGAGTGTFLAAFLGGPIIGLIPAIACSSTPPKPANLSFPNVELMRNTDYVSGYTAQAKIKKAGKTWGNFGIATGILVALVLGAASSGR
jgi:hypothetical protein